jgi:hypothetical protein
MTNTAHSLTYTGRLKITPFEMSMSDSAKVLSTLPFKLLTTHLYTYTGEDKPPIKWTLACYNSCIGRHCSRIQSCLSLHRIFDSRPLMVAYSHVRVPLNRRNLFSSTKTFLFAAYQC